MQLCPPVAAAKLYAGPIQTDVTATVEVSPAAQIALMGPHRCLSRKDNQIAPQVYEFNSLATSLVYNPAVTHCNGMH